MSAIVNDRDVLLQAAVTRFTPPPLPQEIQDAVDATKGLQILSTGDQFKVAVGGSTTPASITFTIAFRLISGTVTWSVTQGTATLTGSGNTRTLSPGNMSTDRVRIKASLTVNGITYSDEIDISRVRDGSTGSDGIRGTVHVYVARAAASWSDADANSAITTFTGSATKVIGDMVTQSRAQDGWAETRYWTGSVWQFLEQVIDGNLIVTGTLSADKITTGTLTGRTVRTADSGSRVEIDGSNNIINFQGPSGSPVTLGPPTSGANNFHLTIPSGRGGMMVLHSGSGSAVHIGNTSGNAGHGLIVQTSPTSPTYAPLRLTELGSLPTNRANGSICYYGGWLCFANGSHWFQSDGTQLT